MKLTSKQIKEVSKYLKKIGCKYASKKFKKDWSNKEIKWHEEDLPKAISCTISLSSGNLITLKK